MLPTASEVNPFFSGSVTLHAAGMAVLPISRGDKDPLVSGFNRWKRRPGRISLDRWREKFPSANLGYVPGLTGRDGVVVIDDDGGAADKIVDLFGKTPGMVKTRRGRHFLYRAPRGLERFSLKKLGINADVKLGNDIVVGPGSVHETGHVYDWSGCDERVIADLPTLDVRNVGDLLRGEQERKKAAHGMRSASRELALNDYLIRHAMNVDACDELADIAKTWNEDLIRLGVQMLSDAEVMKVTRAVWKDREGGKLECWHGRRSTVRSTMSEFDQLTSAGKDGTLAYVLLMKLRGEHGARMKRGETFALNQVAMAKAQTIPGWSRYDYEKARAVLLEVGKLVIVDQPGNSRDGRMPTRYKLA